jgi:hypothetical protein
MLLTISDGIVAAVDPSAVTLTLSEPNPRASLVIFVTWPSGYRRIQNCSAPVRLGRAVKRIPLLPGSQAVRPTSGHVLVPGVSIRPVSTCTTTGRIRNPPTIVVCVRESSDPSCDQDTPSPSNEA